MTASNGLDVSGHDALTNLALLALGGIVAIAGLLRIAGNVAAFVTGAEQPTGGLAAGIGVFAHRATPGPPSAPPGSTPMPIGPPSPSSSR